jgi:hypothetical protein
LYDVPIMPTFPVDHGQPRRREIADALRDDRIACAQGGDQLGRREPGARMLGKVLEQLERPDRAEAAGDKRCDLVVSHYGPT